MLYAADITRSFGGLPILKGVTLHVNKKEILSIIGPSGAGKSTLLHILGTLDKPDSGSLVIGDTQINQLHGSALSQFRNRHIGFVFQFHHLLQEFSALENVCMPAFIAGLSRQQASQRASELLKTFGLLNRAHHKPSQLSGGEQQRIAIARALINNPSVILADEPSGNLDSENAKSLHQLFVQLRDTMNLSFVIVTHNQHLADSSDRVVVMKDGLLV